MYQLLHQWLEIWIWIKLAKYVFLVTWISGCHLKQQNSIWRAFIYIFGKNSKLMLRKVYSLFLNSDIFISMFHLVFKYNMFNLKIIIFRIVFPSCLPHAIRGTTIFSAIKNYKLKIIFKYLLSLSYSIYYLILWGHLLTTFILITSQLHMVELSLQMGRWWVISPSKV